MRRGAWLLVLLGFAACAAPPRRPTLPLPPEVQGIIDELEARWRQFHDLRGIVELTFDRRERSQRFIGPLLLKAPAALRFEALSPLGQPMLVVAMDGDTFTLYSLVEHRALVGPATERAMGRWLNFPLPPTTVVALLAGYVLPLSEIDVGVLVPEGDQLRLDLWQEGGFVQRIWFDPLEKRARRAEWKGRGTRLEAMVGTDHRLTLEVPDEGTSLSLRYQERTLDVGLPLEQFRVTLPEGASVTRLP